MLKHLRILIVISFALYFFTAFGDIFYKPDTLSPFLVQYKNTVVDLLRNNTIYDALILVLLVMNAYADAALWLGYNSGRWSLVVTLMLAYSANLFLDLHVVTSAVLVLELFNMVILGMIINMAYTSPLKAEFTKKKQFKILPMLGLFLLFLFLLVALPVLAGFLLKLR